MWRVAEAKNKFSEPFTRALTEGPQRVSRRGETVIVLSEAEYRRLSAQEKPRMTLAEYLMSGPSLEGVDLERRKSPMRPVDLE